MLSKGAVAMAMLGGAVLVAGACGSGHGSAGSSATTSPAAAPTTAGSNGSGQLNDLSAALSAGQKATFKAVYTATGSGGNQTVTIEQRPPATRFSTGQGAVISTGSKTYFCSTGSSAQCVIESGANPLAGLISLYSPTAALSALQAAETAVAAHASGYNVTFSQQTFAGQASKCVSVSGPGGSGRYCVTDAGILAYAQTPPGASS